MIIKISKQSNIIEIMEWASSLNDIHYDIKEAGLCNTLDHHLKAALDGICEKLGSELLDLYSQGYLEITKEDG